MEILQKYSSTLCCIVNGHEGIVKLLLNAFSEEKQDKLIEYVMKEDENKQKYSSALCCIITDMKES